MIPQPVYILFGAAFTTLTAIALGRLLFHVLKVQLRRVEETLLAFMAGSACLSGIAFALSAAQLVYKGVFLGVGLAAIGLAAWLHLLREKGEPFPQLPRFWKILFGVLFTVYVVVYFTNAMMPERSPDGSAYHLGLVARYAREHGFHRITTNMYASLSQGVEMVYLFAFVFGRHSAAALMHFGFLVALPLMMLSYARRFGFPAAGVTGALLVFFSPVVGMDGVTAYIDVAVASILFAVFYLLQIWDEARSPGLLVAIGLLAGFSYAAKYTAFLAVPYALGFIAWKLLRDRQPAWKPLAVVSLCALVMIAPWAVKNWLWVDNPFSPFFNKIFANPYVHVSLEQEWTAYLRTYTDIKSVWQIPLEAAVRGRVLCGVLGPVFLLVPLGLLALRERAGRRLLAAGLLFGSVYPLNIGTRFLIPAAPYFALALGLVLVRARGMAPLVLVLHGLASWPANVKVYSDQYAWRLEKPLPWKQAFRKDDEDGYLTRSMPSYITARMIEQFVPRGERVFVLTQTAESYTTRDILVGYQAALNLNISDILLAPIIEDYHPRRHIVFRFPARSLRGVRVVQTASSKAEHWTVAEFHLSSGGAELRRTSSWKLLAKPNPWYASMAFDGNLATRWRSWQILFPGMYLGAEFDQPQTADSVLLECAFGQYDMRMRLEELTASGEWRPLDATQQMVEAPAPPGMRRAAVAAILSRNVRWIMLNESDIGCDDLLKNTAEWGITQVADRNGAHLFKLY